MGKEAKKNPDEESKVQSDTQTLKGNWKTASIPAREVLSTEEIDSKVFVSTKPEKSYAVRLKIKAINCRFLVR